MRRRIFIKTSLAYIANSILGLFVFGRSTFFKLPTHFQITFVTALPYKMSKTEYNHFKNQYQDSKGAQAVFDKCKKRYISKEYIFTGTQSILTMVFNNQQEAVLFQRQLADYIDIDKKKQLGVFSKVYEKRV